MRNDSKLQRLHVYVRVYSDSVMVWEKDKEPIQGLDVARWSEKRVQVDFSNRLVFYSVKKEDEGHYRCIVDLVVAAMYHLEGLNDTILLFQFFIILELCSVTECVQCGYNNRMKITE